jgi:3-isopropylmalate/(R)-2-methylmalate dehydratase small subunit
MEPFVTHRGRLVVLDWSDVNTDLIIPARYLKRVERVGFGPLLFADKRYEPGGAPLPEQPERHGAVLPEFPLNHPSVQRASVLVVGHNFGCGSSREHAVWAVMQAGYRAVIAPGKGEGFADIFETNALNNGLLVIELADGDWQALARAGRAEPGTAEVTIDLRVQTVTLHLRGGPLNSSSEPCFRFEIPESHRQRLLEGMDAIAETLLLESAIQCHESQLPDWIIPRPTDQS